jgi:hypothetical protein
VTAIDESHCARCLRVPGPKDFDYQPGDDTPPVSWEVLSGSDGEVIGVMCPDCITPEEQQAIDEDAMDTMNLITPEDLMDLGEEGEDDE